MRRSVLMSLAAVALVATNAFAQAKDFAGTWTMVQDPAQQQGGGGGGGRRGGGGGGVGFAGMTFTVTQDANSITVTRTMGENSVSAKFMTDGSDSKNEVMGRGGQATEVVSKAKWEGDALVISTTREFNGNSTTSTQKIWIENGNLMVENSRPGRDGNPMVSKVTYKKG